MRATRASIGSASVPIRADRTSFARVRGQARTESRGRLRLPRPRRAATPRAQSDDHAEAGAGTAAAVTAPFHLAVPVHSLSAARTFYGELLGFTEGRSAATWVDYNMSVARRPQTGPPLTQLQPGRRGVCAYAECMHGSGGVHDGRLHLRCTL